MAPERGELRYLPPVRIVVLFFYFLTEFFIFLWIKCVSKKKQELEWKEVWSFEQETPKSARKLRVNENKWTEYTKKLMKENPLWECTEVGEQMQQCFQDNGRRPGLVGYVMWKSDTKSAAWESLDTGIHSDSSPVFSYPSQITLYRSLHAHQWLILESTIQEISYLGSPSIMTGVGASYTLLEKVLDVAGSSMDTWKTGWTECMDSGKRKVNDRVSGWAMIS